MNLPDWAQSILTDALAAERHATTIRFHLFRACAVALFLVFHLLLGRVFGLTEWTGTEPHLAAYLIFALAVLATSKRWPSIRRASLLALPVIDMAAIYALQMAAIDPTTSLTGLAYYTVGVYVLAIAASYLFLETWLPPICGLAAIGWSLPLLRLAQEPPGSQWAAALLLLLAAGGASFAVRRVNQLVGRVLHEELKKERLERYFSPQIAERIQRLGTDECAGEEYDLTVLFADLRDFTEISENLSGREVVALLNDVHSRLVSSVFDTKGTLDKYIGDGVMAWFGAPDRHPDHANRAVECAIRMRHAMGEFNRERGQKGLPPLRIGIGIHSGKAIVGDIGAPSRREYTAVGDTVNLAARIEGLTKQLGEEVLISEETRNRLTTSIPLKAYARMQVKGRSEPVTPYALAPDAAPSWEVT